MGVKGGLDIEGLFVVVLGGSPVIGIWGKERRLRFPTSFAVLLGGLQGSEPQLRNQNQKPNQTKKKTNKQEDSHFESIFPALKSWFNILSTEICAKFKLEVI